MKMIDQAKTAQLGRYDLSYPEANELAHSLDAKIDAVWHAYKYGFLRGQRAAKTEFRREHNQLLDRDKTGWYGFITRCALRNIDNEQLLSLTGVSMRTLEEKLAKGSA